MNAQIPYALNTVYKIKGSYTSEYILVENRQTGSGWNRFLPAGGLLVWRIYYSTVDLIEAVSRAPSQGANESDPFPGSGSVRTLTDFSGSSNSKFISGANSNVTFQNISNAGPTMTADISPYWYGNVAQSQTWNGTVLVGEDLSVLAGVALTIAAGTALNLTNHSRLTVNGYLSAIGTSSSPIVFDFISPNGQYNNGIWLNAGGTLQYCTVKNASFGIYSNGSVPSVQNCSITNNTFGIYLNNAGVSNNSIANNTISSNSTDGIYVYNSQPRYIENNTISNNGYDGIYCSNWAEPYLRYNKIQNNSHVGVECTSYSPAHFALFYGDPGHNSLTANFPYLDVAASNHSNVTFGPYGQNSIYGGAIYYVAASSYSQVYGRYNWWGQYPPPAYKFYTDGTSTIDYSNALQSDPNSGMVASLSPTPAVEMSASRVTVPDEQASATREEKVNIDSSFFDSELTTALEKVALGKFDDAIAVYKDRFGKEVNELKKEYILTQLAGCYRSAGRKDLSDFLSKQLAGMASKNGRLYATALELQSLSMVGNGEYDAAVKNYMILYSGFSSDSTIYKNALFNLGYIHFWWLKDTTAARKYFTELNSKYPNDGLTLHSRILLGEIVAPASRTIGSDEDENTQSVETVYKIELLDNYPNPFNPTTVIRYALRTDTYVTLRVYDMLGREVVTLVDGNRTAGYHEIRLDGSRLASGVYFYRLIAGKYISTKKMLLVK